MNSVNFNTINVFFKTISHYTLSTLILPFLLVIGLYQNINAQCAKEPVLGLCFGGNGPVTNGLDINHGQTYWFNGVDTFPDGVNMNGGTLRICGDLTLSTMNFTRGYLYIEPGGTFTLIGKDTLYLNGNSLISNSGTLDIQKSIVMSDSNNTIINTMPASTMLMDSGRYILRINSSTSTFINQGYANIHTIIIESTASAGAVCLGSGSCLNLTDLNNNFLNSFTVNIGLGVLRYTGNALLNFDLTSSAGLVICQATDATLTGPGTFGSAIVIPDCASCGEALAFILPIELISFSGKQNNTNIILHWSTETESQNDYFTVEKSKDGIQWSDIGMIAGAGNSTSTLHYNFQDNQPQRGIQFYRLKQTDFDGRFATSSAISINFETSANDILIYPNPNSSNQLTILGFEPETNYTLDLKNVTGQLLYTITSHSPSLDLPVLARGIYFLSLRQEGSTIVTTTKYIIQ